MKRIVFLTLVISTTTWGVAQPGTFDLVSPPDSSWTNATPLFTWGTSAGASHYELWLDGYMFAGNVAGTEYRMPAGLSETQHTWYVRAVSPGGQSTPSNQSWTVNVDGTPPGASDRGVFFDGAEGYVSIPNSASLNPASQISLEAWVCFFSGGTHAPRILAKQTSSQGYGLVLDGTGSSPTLTFHVNVTGGNNVLRTAAMLQAGSWYHVAGVYDGTFMRIYINGALSISSILNRGNVVATSGALNIGRKPVGAFDQFRGYLN